MSPRPPAPSRPLKWAAALIRTALWLVAGVWLLAGLTLGLVHGLILPRLAQWTPELEALATQTIGLPVRLGQVTAQQAGLLPVLNLNDVQLLDQEGRTALRLERVAVMASVTSLWRLGVEQIHIDQPALDIRRRVDGRIEVAGVPLSANPDREPGDSPALDWLFSQTELVIRQGTLRWTDDRQRGEPVELEQVDVVLRNAGRRHQIRLDATPAEGLGGRLTWMADFRSPLLTLHPGRWQDWRGTVYAHLPQVNLAEVGAPAHLTQALGLDVQRGQGALRWWLDMDQGQVTGSTLDVALAHIQARFASAPAALALNHAHGRLELSQRDGEWTLGVPQLSLVTATGQQWQGEGLQAQWTPDASEPSRSRGRFHSGALDLGVLAPLAAALPLPPAVLAQLQALQPTGQLDELDLSWQGHAQGWSRFAVKGAGSRLALQAAPEPEPRADGSPVRPQRPGFRNASVRFEFDQSQGQAQLAMRDGELVLPGVFEEPVVPIASLAAQLRWTLGDHGPTVRFSQVKFRNDDLQGQASGEWQASDPATSPSGGRFPGILRLDGQLQQALGNRVHRYLPLGIPATTRHYVRDAILAGTSRDVRFKLHGDLWNMPFAHPDEGDFRITAKVQGVDYAYIPPSWQTERSLRWPTLRQLDGELRFVRNGLSFEVARGHVADASGLLVRSVKAKLPDFSRNPTLEVQARIDGPLSEALGVVRSSPLAEFTGGALNDTRAQGATSIQFNLQLPLMQLAQTTVKGQVQLRGNDLTVVPDTPTLRQARGLIDFSEQGFQIRKATAGLLGGDIQVSGGWQKDASGRRLRLTGAGTATAEGLRQERTLPVLSTLAQHVQGQTPYQAVLEWDQNGPAWTVRSDLDGLQVHAPAPLNKSPLDRWPLVYRQMARADGSGRASPVPQVELDWQAPEPLRLRLQQTGVGTGGWSGWLAVGAAAVNAQRPAQAAGLSLDLRMPQLDADAWMDFLEVSAGPATSASVTALKPPLPDRIRLKAERLKLGSWWLNEPDLDAQRHLTRWTGRIRAAEMEGQFDYLPGDTQRADGRQSRLHARLKHLHLHTQRGAALDTPARPTPHQLPALDLDIASLNVDERHLGRLQLQASHGGSSPERRQWQLDELTLTTPEAQLTGRGTWGEPGAGMEARVSQGASPSVNPPGQRWTSLDFELAIRDADALLQRFNMPGVVRGGKGQITGQVSWQGLPYAMHTPSLSGRLALDLGSGQFLKADPGIAKLLGVLSLQSLPRRLTLDFSDVFADGFAFDWVRGDATITRGTATTDNLRMKGPHATVTLQGRADIGRETQDIRAEVIPELNAGTASLLATVVNPAMGLGTLLAQSIIREPLAQASKQQFHIHGTWTDPVVDRIRSPNLEPSNTNPP